MSSLNFLLKNLWNQKKTKTFRSFKSGRKLSITWEKKSGNIFTNHNSSEADEEIKLVISVGCAFRKELQYLPGSGRKKHEHHTWSSPSLEIQTLQNLETLATSSLVCVLMLLKSSILSPSLAIPFLSFLVTPIQPLFVDMAQSYRTGRNSSIGQCGSCRLQSLLWSVLCKVEMV